MRRTIAAVGLVACFTAAAAVTTGCSSYYRVTDPTTGKQYYTTELKQKGNGAATLKDSRTGNTVNLQNSEIAQVSKEEYETGRFAAQPAADNSDKGDSNAFK
jgi:hypothetical protein